MKSTLIAIAAVSLLATPAFAEDAVGKWTGDLIGAQGPVPVSAVFTKSADGKLAGVGTAPNGSVDFTDIVTDGASLSFNAPGTGTYKATWDDAKKMWIGKLNQNGAEAVLNLKRAQ